jgi:hypothetical protein
MLYVNYKLCNQLKLYTLSEILYNLISPRGNMDIQLKLIVLGSCIAGMGLMIAYMWLYRR